MIVPGNSAQSWRAAFTGSYDDEQLALLFPLIEPHSWVLDVGASLGFYTIPLALAAKKVDARIVAIEPVHNNCDVIRQNVRLNGLDHVVFIQQCALGDTASEVTLHVETGGTGNATIVTGLDSVEVEWHDRAGNTRSSQSVQVYRLDDLQMPSEVSGRRCSLIKIDVEGFEMNVLAGAASFISSHRPAIFGEFSPSWLKTRGSTAFGPAEWAAKNGYSCRELVHARASLSSDEQTISLRPLVHSGTRTGTDLMLLPVPDQDQLR